MQKVVVLLPEGKLFDQLFSEAIAPAVPGARRLGSEFSSESRLGALCNGIETADLVLADLSARNPNIFYAVGFAHGIGKKVLMLAAHLEDFPFDKSKHTVLGYSGDRQFLRSELAAYFESGTLRSPSSSDSQSDARARFLETFGDILARHGYEHRGDVQLENPTTYVLLDQDMDLALVQDLARKARELGLRLKLM